MFFTQKAKWTLDIPLRSNVYLRFIFLIDHGDRSNIHIT